MAVTLNANTSTGFIATSDTSGVLQLQTGGTTAVTVDASQNVNFAGTAQRITGDFSNATIANRVAFQTSTVNGITNLAAIPNGTASDAAFSVINNSDPTNASRLSISINAATDARLNSAINGTGTYLPMTFFTGGSESLRLSATSKAVILAGGSTSANGTGITFPAAFSGSSDVNTLDDYEEGTFSPSVFGLSTAGTTTFTIQEGKYTKVGNVVTITINVGWSNATGTGTLAIGALPFTVSAYSALSMYNNGLTFNASSQMSSNTEVGTTYLSMNQFTTAGVVTGVPVDTSVSRLMISGSYFTAT